MHNGPVEPTHGLRQGTAITVFCKGRVLLTKRPDFEIWCLPGGASDPGESAIQTAQRELHEETGVTVPVDGLRLVGTYRMAGDHPSQQCLFRADLDSVRLDHRCNETSDIATFDPTALPEPIMWWHLPMIEYAIAALATPISRTIFQTCLAGAVSHTDLYRLRDESGLTPSEFFEWCFPRPEQFASSRAQGPEPGE